MNTVLSRIALAGGSLLVVTVSRPAVADMAFIPMDLAIDLDAHVEVFVGDEHDPICQDTDLAGGSPADPIASHHVDANCPGVSAVADASTNGYIGDLQLEGVVNSHAFYPEVGDATLDLVIDMCFLALHDETISIAFRVVASGSQGDSDLEVRLVGPLGVLDSYSLRTGSWVDYDFTESVSGALVAGQEYHLEVRLHMNAWNDNFNLLAIGSFDYSTGRVAPCDVPVAFRAHGTAVDVTADVEEEDAFTFDPICDDHDADGADPAGSDTVYTASAACGDSQADVSASAGRYDGQIDVSGQVATFSGVSVIGDSRITASARARFFAMATGPLTVGFDVDTDGSQGGSVLTVRQMEGGATIAERVVTTASWDPIVERLTLSGFVEQGKTYDIVVTAVADAYDNNFNDFSVGNLGWCTVLGVATPTLGDGATSPSLAFPNPFSVRTFIQYESEEAAPVHVVLYDISGRQVRVLRDVSARTPGIHGVAWDGTDDHGRVVRPGVYVYRVRVGGRVSSGRVVLAN